MQSQDAAEKLRRTGWSSFLSKTAAAILLFELLSGLAITFGPFHPAIEWDVLLHTIVGALTLAPLVWYSVAHWKDYRDQALSDVLLLGYVGLGLTIIWSDCQTGWRTLGSLVCNDESNRDLLPKISGGDGIEKA